MASAELGHVSTPTTACDWGMSGQLTRIITMKLRIRAG